MPISPIRAEKALRTLVRRGLISADQIPNYEGLIKEGVTYKALMVAELGPVIGELYIAEEEAQHWIMDSIRLNSAHISVPEVLLIEDNIIMEPWHEETYSGAPGKEKFEQEAAEPWHVSIREKYRPDPVIRRWFRRHPEYLSHKKRILSIAYPHLARRRKAR